MNGDNGELPEGWASARVRDYYESWGGATPSTSVNEYWGGQMPWISSKDVKARRVSADAECVTDRALNETRLRRCPVGGVLVVIRSGVLAHTLPVALTDREVVINQDLKAFDSGNRELNSWLALALEERADQILEENRKEGTTVQSIRFDQLKDIEIPLPPLAEQRRIIAAVEAVLAKVSAARERLNRVPAILKRFRQAVLSAACSGRLTADWREKNPIAETAPALLERVRQERRREWEVKFPKKRFVECESADASELPELPESWCWVRADEVVEQGADIRYGIVQPGPNLDGGIPYVRGIDIQEGMILVDQLWRTSAEIAEQYRNSALKEGDVLLGIIRHLKVAVVPKALDGGNMARTTARLRPSTLVSSDYLAKCLESPLCQFWLKANYRGGTDMPKVNIEDVVRLPIPVAPLAEQQEIVRRVSDLFALADVIEERLTDARRMADQLTQAVLAKAFRGELVPTEAELTRRENRTYETASDLLARIRAEREQPATPANGKPKRSRRPAANES